MSKSYSNPYSVWFFAGNIKVGNMLTWNKLAGGGTINGCKGSCAGCCEGCYNPNNPEKSECYVFQSYVQYGDHVIGPHIRNTNAIRHNLKDTFKELDLQLSRRKVVLPIRIHASGEIESAQELMAWFDLARKHPEYPFYIYSKNFEVIDKVMTRLKVNKKQMIPSNFFLNISIWHENGIDCYLHWKNCKNIRAFVYDDGFDYAAHGLHIDGRCPAYRLDPKTGKVKLHHDLTCDKCKLCFQPKAKVLTCLSH